jgi:hypothetical protein
MRTRIDLASIASVMRLEALYQTDMAATVGPLENRKDWLYRVLCVEPEKHQDNENDLVRMARINSNVPNGEGK